MNFKTHSSWELDTEVLLTAKYVHLHTMRRVLSVSASVLPWTVKAYFMDQEIQCHGGPSEPVQIRVGKVVAKECRKKKQPFQQNDEIQPVKAQEFLLWLALVVVEQAPLELLDLRNTAKINNNNNLEPPMERLMNLTIPEY